MKQKIICKECERYTYNNSFCSNKCKHKYFKKNKIGAFFNPEIRKAGLIKSHITCKKRKVGYVGLSTDERSKAGKKGAKILKKLGKGFYDKKICSSGGIAGAKKCRELKVGAYFDKGLKKDICSKGGTIAGPIVARILREKKDYIFKNLAFDSKSEMEIAINLHYQYNMPIIDGITCHVIVGSYTYDFFINDTFIEYHPHNPLYDKDNNYESRRKNNLITNNKNNEVIIIA